MKYWRGYGKSSIIDKLVHVSQLTTLIALILTGIILIVYELLSFRYGLIDQLRGQARIVGANTAAALTFNDQRAAEETLRAFKEVRHIKGAFIYLKNGDPFAAYHRDPYVGQAALPPFQSSGYSLSSRYARLYEPIMFDGEILGVVCIELDLSSLYDRLLGYTGIVALVVLLSGGIAFLLHRRWQEAITRPILDLATLMHSVSEEQNYSARAVSPGEEELDSLVESFNDMLSQIQKRDFDLGLHRMHLQDLVARRTSELAQANEHLQQELSDRRRAEEELKDYQKKMEALINSSSDLIYLKDRQFRYLIANTACQRFLGKDLEEIIGRTDFDILPGDYASIIGRTEREVLHGNKPIDREMVLAGSDYHVVMQKVVDEAGQIIGVAAVIRSITEQRRLQDQLKQAQKMEAVGQLAGGIAHDFNNIMTAIIGYATLLHMKIPEDDPLSMDIGQILSSSERAANLTQGLLAFSRKQVIQPIPVNVNQIVRRVEKLLSRLIGEDINFKTDLTDEDLVCMVDPTQMEQVLVNLATNARDAMSNTGLLTISTERVTLDQNYVKVHGLKKAGPHALITVSDTGEGMDEATKERIFDPFFTTKELGRGTGLGLSIVYGIINQLNGYINVYSEPGVGTSFHIYLPLESVHAIEEKQKAPYPDLVGGKETILVAEDQLQVRELIKDVLERFGYRVILAEDGDHAIEQFKKHKDEIHLVILDVIMPKKNGKEAFDEIRNIRSDMKVIFSSGYTADILQRRGIMEEPMNFIAKPVAPRELLAKIREVLA